MGGGWEGVALASAAVADRFSAKSLKQQRNRAKGGASTRNQNRGPEQARAKAQAGARVTLAFPESSPLRRSLPRYLSAQLAKSLKSSGVHI